MNDSNQLFPVKRKRRALTHSEFVYVKIVTLKIAEIQSKKIRIFIFLQVNLILVELSCHFLASL
jgi:hypothetical protein